MLIGGAGFIGSSLTKKLSEQSNIAVTVVHVGDIVESEKLKGISYKKIDFSNTAEDSEELFNKVDCLVLLSPPNEDLIRNILQIAQKKHIKKIIYTSTLLLYPDSDERHSETANLDPINEYEIKKNNEENLLKNLANNTSKVCIVRLGNVYGDKKNKGIVNKIIKALENSTVLRINGNGEHTRDYIFIDNVTDVLYSLIFIDQKQYLEIYNVCSGESVSINELISELEKISGKKIIKENSIEIPEKKFIFGDNAKIKQTINFKNIIHIKEGLEKAYHNYLKE